MDTGAAAKVHDGEKSNNALIFWPRSRFVNAKHDDNLMCQLCWNLGDYGYTPRQWEIAYYKTGKVNELKITCLATKAELEERIKALGAKLKVNPGKSKAFMWFSGHGGLGHKARLDKVEDPLADRGAGELIYPGSSVSIELDDAFIASFYEDVIVDDPEVARSGPPALVVSTSEEGLLTPSKLSSQYPVPVTVSLDGVVIGGFDMLLSSAGETYEVEIDDSAIWTLYYAGVLEDLVVDVTFDFPPGYFRVASVVDFLEGDFDHYGIGLDSPPLGAEVEVLGTTGACCLEQGECVPDVAEDDCELLGGFYKGHDSVCGEAAGCPPGVGACCFDRDGSCCDAKRAACEKMKGTPKEAGKECLGDRRGNGVDDRCEKEP